MREDLFKIDEVIGTSNFLHQYDIDTYEQLLDFKQQCTKKVEQLNSQKPHRLKKELTRALLDVTIYQNAFDMYTSGGFRGMKDEAERYNTARNYLKSKGYGDISRIEQLRIQVNNDVDTIAKLNNDIYKQKGLIKECDNAIERHGELMEKINRQQQHNREKEREKDVSRSI